MTVGMIASVILIGSMMRSPITTIPLMIGDLARQLGTSTGSLGILTTLPLVMFMLFSNFASAVLKRLGFKRSLMLTLIILLLGSLFRLIVTMPTILLGTILIGTAIAYLNVFMPSFVSAYFPQRIGTYTTLYTFSMMFGSSIFNLITAPIIAISGWWSMLVVLVGIPLAALVVWILTIKWVPEEMKTSVEAPIRKEKGSKIWSNKRAWPFLFTFGCQSVIMYTITAWMPPLMKFHHVNPGMVSIIMALFSLMGLPVSIILPQLLTKLNRVSEIVLILSGGIAGLVAAGMLFVQNTSATWFWMLEILLIGYTVNLLFIFVMTMFAIKTTDPYQTARLSGMAQAGGYFISALGPTLYGIAFSSNPTGMIQNLVYIGLVMLGTIMAILIVRIKDV